MKSLRYNLLGLLILIFCFNAQAFYTYSKLVQGKYKVDFTPVQIGFVGNLFDPKGSICGLSLACPISLNRGTYGLSTGVLGGASRHSGVQLNLFNIAKKMYGMQAGLCGTVGDSNINSTRCVGLQINVIINDSYIMHGLQVGIVNNCRKLYGVQAGIVNVARQGYQFGAVNHHTRKED